MTHSKWHLEVIREDIKEGKGTGQGREGQWEAMMRREGTFVTIKEREKKKRRKRSGKREGEERRGRERRNICETCLVMVVTLVMVVSWL